MAAVVRVAVDQRAGRGQPAVPRVVLRGGQGDGPAPAPDPVHARPRLRRPRRPASTRTTQVIEAIADDVDHIPYLYDTSIVTLETGHGCGEVSGSLYKISNGIYGVDIPLSKTLALGETLTLEYWTSYQYPGNLDDPQERQYRRAVMRRLENLDLRVEFHPGMLPQTLWWAVWDGVDGDVVEQDEVTLDREHSAHRFLRSLERAVAGFHWPWKPVAAPPAHDS